MQYNITERCLSLTGDHKKSTSQAIFADAWISSHVARTTIIIYPKLEEAHKDHRAFENNGDAV